MTDSSARQWILVLSLTALALSTTVLAQTASRYAAAYMAAPREVSTFVDAVDSSLVENESYDKDLSRVQRLEDKLRLGRLLRDIQREGDALREALSAVLVGEDDPRLRAGARVLWAVKRLELEDKVRRLDLLRMRFLVVHMGIIAGVATEAATKQEIFARSRERRPPTPPPLPTPPPPTPPPLPPAFLIPTPEALARSPIERMTARTPVRRSTTQAVGYPDSLQGNYRQGWAGVVQELQMSPLLHKRHASAEPSLAESP